MDERLNFDLDALTQAQELSENPMTEKQRDILEAAERLFADLGFSETSTARIAKEAGVSERTLFKYFPTKSDLLKRVLFPLLARTLIPVQLKALRKILTAPYESYFDFFVAFSTDRWQTAQHLGSKLKVLLTQILTNEPFRNSVADFFTKNLWPDIVAAVEKLQSEGKVRTDLDAKKIARMQVLLVFSEAVLRFVVASDRRWNEDGDEAAFLARVLWEGLRPPP